MKKLLLFTSIIMFTSFSYAQSYKSGIGLKSLSAGGGPFGGAGVNFKTFIGGSSALDMTFGGGSNHLAGQLLYEWQRETGWASGLDWYVGLGGTLGVWSTSYAWGDDYPYSGGFFLGADAVIGLDFNLQPTVGIPIDLAVDFGPSVGVINSRGFGFNGSLAVRYIIK